MKQQRNTRQRQIVLETVQQHRDHPTADEIYLDVRSRNPKISRGTVYRNLNLLVGNGQIRHVKLPGVDRFDWRQEPHYHLLCLACGKVRDVPIPYQQALNLEVEAQSGYRLIQHRTVFEGYCPDCTIERPAASEPDSER